MLRIEEEVCEGTELQTAEPVMGCDAGFTMDAATGMCTNGEVKVSRHENRSDVLLVALLCLDYTNFIGTSHA